MTRRMHTAQLGVRRCGPQSPYQEYASFAVLAPSLICLRARMSGPPSGLPVAAPVASRRAVGSAWLGAVWGAVSQTTPAAYQEPQS